MAIDPRDAALRGAEAARGIGREFRDFLFKNNVLSLALAVVIGAAVGKVVSAAVEHLIMPFVNVITPKDVPWRTWAPGFGEVRFGVGAVLASLLDFLIISAVVFAATKAFLRAARPAPTKTCPACREGIHPEATRCRFCGSEQPGAPAAG